MVIMFHEPLLDDKSRNVYRIILTARTGLILQTMYWYDDFEYCSLNQAIHIFHRRYDIRDFNNLTGFSQSIL